MNDKNSIQSLRWFFHAAVLWAFAVAQPLYAKISENVSFLLTHQAAGLDVVVYSLIWLVAGPVVVWATVVATWRFSPHLGKWVRGVWIWSLVLVALFPIFNGVAWVPEMAALVAAAILAAIPTVLYHTQFWRGVLDVLTPAPLLFVGYFLLYSPASVVVLPEGGDARADRGARSDIPVVIMLFDEFPGYSLLDEHGDIDAVRFPGFARLASLSTWYPDATTVSDSTMMAVPALVSGIFPIDERRKPPVYQHYPENLFDQLGNERTLWVIENGTRMCRPSLCPERGHEAPSGRGTRWGEGLTRQVALHADSLVIFAHMALPGALAEDLPEFGTRWAGFAGLDNETVAEDDQPPDIVWGRRMAEFERFLEQVERLRPDHFMYMHAMLPHAPWVHFPDGRMYGRMRSGSINGIVPKSENNGVEHLWRDDSWAVTLGEQRFLLQAGFVDRLIDRTLDRLRASGLFDDALVIVAADHGAAFTAGTSRRALTDRNFAEIFGVPLFIKYPGQTGGQVRTGAAELIDIAPTILDVLGAEPLEVDGQSLVGHSDRLPRPRLVNDRNDILGYSAEQIETGTGRAVARKFQRFQFADSDGFPRPREFASWFGTDVAELRIESTDKGPGAENRLDLMNNARWPHTPTNDGFLPLRIEGRLVSDVEDPDVLLAAINGRIAGAGRVFSYPEANGLFELMVEPKALSDDANHLQIYALKEDDSGFFLELLFDDEWPAIDIDQTDDQPDPAGDDDGEMIQMLGHWIEFDGDRATSELKFTGDWHEPRDGIRWSGAEFGLIIPVHPRRQKVRLRVEAIPFVDARHAVQKVDVRLGGELVGQWQLDQARIQMREVILDFSDSQSAGPVALQFHVPTAAVPKELGINGDTRELGIAFHRLRLDVTE